MSTNDFGADSFGRLATEFEAFADRIARFDALVTERFDDLLNEANEDLATYIRREWADHGSISSSITTERVGVFSYRTLSDHEASRFIEDGTRSHTITPKPGTDYLHFKVDGQWVKTVKVNHPGTDADPAFKKGVNRLRDRLEADMQRIVREAWIESGYTYNQ